MARFEPMSRRRRLLVFGSLAGLVAMLLAVTWYLGRPMENRGDLAWTGVDFTEYPEVDLLQRYIRVDTSQETGSEIAGAQFLAAELRAMGLEPQIERLGENRANLWAVLEGESPEALVLHNHIDVSGPGDLSGWDFPPFAAEIDHLWLYGRGTFDMKSVAIAQLAALEALMESGVEPHRSVIFLATGSEEIGSRLGTRWVLDQHPALRDRAWAVLTEGGVLEPKNLEEIKYWGIEFAQKSFLAGSICAGSEAELVERAGDIIRRAKEVFAPRLVPPVARFLEHYATTRENNTFVRILEEGSALRDPAEFDRLPAYLKALFRDEIYFFPAVDDPEGGWTAPFLIHLLPGSDPEEVKERLLPDWLTHGGTVTYANRPSSSAVSSTDHPAFEILVEVVEERHPEASVGPFYLCLAATDSRFFREAGIPSYGFSPFVIFNTDTFRKDQVNERIGLPGYVMGVDLYRQAVARLAGAAD